MREQELLFKCLDVNSLEFNIIGYLCSANKKLTYADLLAVTEIEKKELISSIENLLRMKYIKTKKIKNASSLYIRTFYFDNDCLINLRNTIKQSLNDIEEEFKSYESIIKYMKND